MSLQWHLSREVPEDTAQIGQAILAPQNLYRQMGDRFDQLFPQEQVFADLYDSQGRGAISPLLLALVTILQMLEKVPDRVAAAYVVSRIDWKYALHLSLTYPGFHFTDLYAFRTRLLEQAQERRVFEQLLSAIQDQGWIRRRGKLRTDSTHVLGVVERLSQLELVAESLRMALLAVLRAAPHWAARHLPAAFQEAYQQALREYGLSAAQVKAQLIQTGQDGFWFLAQVDHSAPAPAPQLTEVATLRTVLAQQFPQGPSGPPALRRPSGQAVIESPHEPQVRFAHKRGKNWIGYKLQVSESCDADQPHLILDLEPTGALDNDSPELPKIQARLKAQDTSPGEQYVDQGYMSGEHLVKSAQQGICLMGVPLEDTQGPAGFRQADFTIDESARKATCPAGQVSRVWSEPQDESASPAQIQIRFDGPTCQGCRFFGRCTTSLQGRSLSLHPYRAALLARRAEAKTLAFQKKMHLRAGIEGTISELVRGHGLRWARYRGLAKLRLQAYFTAAAVNLKRLGRWWTHSPQPALASG